MATWVDDDGRYVCTTAPQGAPIPAFVLAWPPLGDGVEAVLYLDAESGPTLHIHLLGVLDGFVGSQATPFARGLMRAEIEAELRSLVSRRSLTRRPDGGWVFVKDAT
jgi:hypothetical protein